MFYCVHTMPIFIQILESRFVLRSAEYRIDKKFFDSIYLRLALAPTRILLGKIKKFHGSYDCSPKRILIFTLPLCRPTRAPSRTQFCLGLSFFLKLKFS